MTALTLVIGNKNYSSWSLRPWLLLKHLGVEFQERLVPLYQPGSREELLKCGPSGKVPTLLAHGSSDRAASEGIPGGDRLPGELRIWDSLAICEYITEVSGRGWPKDPAARAVARSVSAEMHAGFSALRNAWPMNSRAHNRRVPMTPPVKADIERIEAIWADCRSRFGTSGDPWLFGEYSVADAMYAPVVLRFNTYGTHFSDDTRSYMKAVIEDPLMQEWLDAAKIETWTIESSEVG
jgi:glutathione S-transferase